MGPMRASEDAERGSMPVVRFIADTDGGGGTSSDCRIAPTAHVPFFYSIASSGKRLVQGSGVQIEFGLLAFYIPGNFSLQRTFALVRARATGLLRLSCAIDPVRSYERRAVTANGDICYHVGHSRPSICSPQAAPLRFLTSPKGGK